MDKDTALDLALGALEKSVDTCFDRYSHEEVMSRPEHFINQAITAIKQALAAPGQEPVAWYDREDDCAYVAAELGGADMTGLEPLYTTSPAAQPAPVQEPVARIAITHYGGAVESWAFAERPSKAPAGVYDVYLGPPAQPAPVQPVPCCGKYETCTQACTPRGKFLGARDAAAQRQWVGLTDDEMDELVNRFARYELVRAVENLLRSKNA